MKLTKKALAFAFSLIVTTGVGIPLIRKEMKRRKNQKIVLDVKKQAEELCQKYHYDFASDDIEKTADYIKECISGTLGIPENNVEVYEEVKDSGKLKVLIRPTSWMMAVSLIEAIGKSEGDETDGVDTKGT